MTLLKRSSLADLEQDDFYVSPNEEHERSSDYVLSQGYGHGLNVVRNSQP
jgi:hypothetical protein